LAVAAIGAPDRIRTCDPCLRRKAAGIYQDFP